MPAFIRRLATLAVLSLAWVVPSAQADKIASGLHDQSAWPLPYWHTDAAMATMALLLLIEEAGWGATLWGAFRHVDEVLAWAVRP